jgi:hypothetical protein
VQQAGGGSHARGGVVVSNVVASFNDTGIGISTGVNDGTSTYPGLVYWSTTATGMRWRNYKVYRDYRLTVKGLIDAQAFRFYDSLGGVLASSVTQVGGEAHVNIHTFAWPIEGHIQVFEDDTWATPLSNGRFPQTSGTDPDFVGGDEFNQVQVGQRPGILINFLDNTEFPDEWALAEDVTLDVREYDVVQNLANPRITSDTLTLVLRDPTGKYVPTRTESSLYPNIRLGRELRMVLEDPDEVFPPTCRFYGRIAEYRPECPPLDSKDSEQRMTIRAEGPLRQLAMADVVLPLPFQGRLVEDDGISGVIPEILKLVPDIIPANSWQLTPCPDDITATDILTAGMTIQTALEQCAIFAGAVYGVLPHYKVASDEPNFYFIWLSRDAHAGEVAAHTWAHNTDDIYSISTAYTQDEV